MHSGPLGARERELAERAELTGSGGEAAHQVTWGHACASSPLCPHSACPDCFFLGFLTRLCPLFDQQMTDLSLLSLQENTALPGFLR